MLSHHPDTAATVPRQRERDNIYYWKCDRAAPFHGTDGSGGDLVSMTEQLLTALQHRFPQYQLYIEVLNSQGNHRTFLLHIRHPDDLGEKTLKAPSHFPEDLSIAFIRTEDGPEQDNYFAVEGVVTKAVRDCGVSVPRVWLSDCSRRELPYAWQILDYLPYPDLNQHYKEGNLDLFTVANKIGVAVAKWQEIRPNGFGPFSIAAAQSKQQLAGLHATYRSYFLLNLHRHLDFLKTRGFLTYTQTVEISATIAAFDHLLELPQGVLVHKDLALWNILGSPEKIAAFIDWDDVIAGDPMDDMSLLACFHDGKIIESALRGYQQVRPLPENWLPRLWLHLLRNMIVKSVIRVGAGYFDRDDGFYLISSGGSGAGLAEMTRQRLAIALRGLNDNCDLDILK